MYAITLNLNPVVQLSQQQFSQICQENPEIPLEKNAKGDLIFMSPTGGQTGKSHSTVNARLWLWNEKNELGEVFDSSTGFILPNGAIRSPDVSWVEKSRYQALTPQEKEQFIPLCPDFVVEILSPTDSLKKTQKKMKEYIANGCRLGWLINRKKQEVEIYRLNKTVEILQKPLSISGEDILPKFTLKLKKIWG